MVAPINDTATRTRLLEAALILFRQRGFHGVGLNEILTAAQAPKGSLYHHFPGGKMQLAVAVVQSIEAGLLHLIETDTSDSTAKLVRHLGAQVIKWMRRTGGDACALLASFAAEGEADSPMHEAVGAAYRSIGRLLEKRLRRDGWTRAQARDRAGIVLALFEGAGLISHTCADARQFSTAIEYGARLCERG